MITSSTSFRTSTVQHGGDEAVFGIPDGELIEGELRRPQMRLVQAWIEIHREELIANWQLAVYGEAVSKIEPL